MLPTGRIITGASLPSTAPASIREQEEEHDCRDRGGSHLAEFGNWHRYGAILRGRASIVGEIDGRARNVCDLKADSLVC